MVFLNPIMDIAFKKLFANNEHKNILISFLNSLLDLSENKKIKDVIINDPHNQPDSVQFKSSIVDVFCTDQSGTQYVVEMQIADRQDFIQRAQYYSAKRYTQQLEHGGRYRTLVPVIFVGVLNFNLFDNPNYLTHHLILDTQTHEQTMTNQEFHFIELKKFNKKLSELTSDVDKWVYLLKNAQTLDAVPKELTEPALKQAMTVLEQSAWGRKDLDAYQAYIDICQAEEAILTTAKYKSRQEGEEKGRQEGKQEEKRAFARKLLDSNNFDLDQIAELTELSVDEIKQIKKN